MANYAAFSTPAAYEPPVSLWRLVEQTVAVFEHVEVKNMLGESLVEQSLDLHEEVSTLLEIWRDFHSETTTIADHIHLPEPPEIREMLVSEISFFVDSIREKYKMRGMDPDYILSKHNRHLIDYAADKMCGAQTDSRPSTGRSQDGRVTPLLSPNSDRLSVGSQLSDNMETLTDKLDVLGTDVTDVVHNLRKSLQDEISQLLADIQFLQACLESEADYRADSQNGISREPTLTALRQERASLERDLLDTGFSKTSPSPPSSAKVKPDRAAVAAPLHMRKYNLSGISTTENNIKKPATASGTATKKLSSPLKASHALLSHTTVDQLHCKQHTSNNTANIKSHLSSHGRAVDIASGVNKKGYVVKVTDMNDSGYVSCYSESSTPDILLPQSDTAVNDRVLIPALAPRPAPPATGRPNSADRFRRMVVSCRDAS